jgi:hypothetical protein
LGPTVVAGKKEKTMEIALKATPELVSEYFRLFVNRRSYTLQSMRPHPESGRHCYYRPKAKGSER